ncbi:phosphatidylinositol N-acetylglucosaminyltransferase subunit C [Polychytrium aggregatum]|uniref:phosphatidylinositol N-acetylglucosaminyltransferase subunit C n=1 Tax=Polychytrium aggregatum TaxID=110093 RepID=UPI0022FE1FC6|nr:phosphatidylinositol N-acetylglucosaminyltransferase subunit C [Polychytrium aggregatum]KAI9209746.1 phosphatidylinositol N-acetylglucosaminyltransferase subunit C [Polychytrium aggregatum]
MPPEWKKILYQKQSYPDNYVPDNFLSEMRQNVDLKNYNYWELSVQAGTLTQQISSITIFVSVFWNSYQGHLSGKALIMMTAVLVVVGYVCWAAVLGESGAAKRQLTIVKGGLIIFSLLFGLSPILTTLTKTISSDTIWALTLVMFLTNLLFHEYEGDHFEGIAFPESLSINAAISASVLLASRLSSELMVFGIVSLALVLFGLFPLFRRCLRRWERKTWKVPGRPVELVLTIAMGSLSIGLLAPISMIPTTVYGCSALFIVFVCPYWLIWNQRFKNEIRGPWDEAKIQLEHTDHGPGASR